MPKALRIRPYARLLTMLGEQLIKNERIALVELIKNSYDADATWVKVHFDGFGDNFEIKKESRIVIEDNGCGMTQDVIERHWLNPATPEKKKRKHGGKKTAMGRIMQGEKGIGRFSMLKLGRAIEVATRPEGEKQEHIIQYDFSSYDDEFLSKDNKEQVLFIDELEVFVRTQKASVISGDDLLLGTRKVKGKPNGTRIEIKNLKGAWSEHKVDGVYKDIARLQSIFVPEGNKKNRNDFFVRIYKDEKAITYQEEYLEKLRHILDERAVIKVEEGRFDADKEQFSFKLDGQNVALGLRDPEIRGISVFRDRFKNAGSVLEDRKIECGSFDFGFYVFDFSSDAPVKYELDKEDKGIVRDHRIYLYRDGIRVYPYGEPDDDWLRIDAYRGTKSAGAFLSNDQVVGYVNISQSENPNLKDKTNREGLIDEGNATDDFITLLQTILAYIRQKPYARYRAGLKDKKVHDLVKTEQVQKDLDALKEAVKDNKRALDIISRTEKEYKAERQHLIQRAETTEELAGIGLSVETASHDVMAIIQRALSAMDALISDSMHGELDEEGLQKELQTIRGMVSFINDQLKNVQTLFKSSKQRRKNIRVKEVLEKVEYIYRRLLKKESIDFVVTEKGSPLVAKTTDAVLLQLLLNLFDNAVYWLQQDSKKNKKIEVVLDGGKGIMIFSDNGPGIKKDDALYIFEPFFSGKGDEGRGLGLYIARQLLERHEYAIELADIRSQHIQSGANFVVSFIGEND